MKTLKYHDITLLCNQGGPKTPTFPGGGGPRAHEEEYQIFQRVLDDVKNIQNPTMIELGSFWALWSLCFRQKFPSGTNILIEIVKRKLAVGEENFKLNGFKASPYWGSVFAEGMFNAGVEVQDTLEDPLLTGRALDLEEICKAEAIGVIDILHADIQGSEKPLIESMKKNNFLSDSVRAFVLATHGEQIHAFIKKELPLCGYSIIEDHPPHGGSGGDGLIYARKCI